MKQAANCMAFSVHFFFDLFNKVTFMPLWTQTIFKIFLIMKTSSMEDDLTVI